MFLNKNYGSLFLLALIVAASLFLRCNIHEDLYCDRPQGRLDRSEFSVMTACLILTTTGTPRRLATEPAADYDKRVEAARKANDMALAYCATKILERDRCLKNNAKGYSYIRW